MRRLVTLLLVQLLAVLVCSASSLPVLGRLGQATKAARIFASPNSASRVFYRVKANEYLVVRESPRPQYLKVLLQNGVYGYVSTEAVTQLPYEVTAKRGTRPGSEGSGIGGNLASRSGMADYALNFIGTPYVWGGNDVNNGIDCSGFVKKMYGKIGIQLPRTAAEQSLVGQPIQRLEELQKGDRLYFWSSKRGKIGHTGMYLGNGYFVHSSMGHRGVATDYLTASWRHILVAARR